LPDDVNVTQNPAYLEGRIEIQDLGSQFILASLGLPPGDHWLDACAGAGGKTLQLATLLGPSGRVTAHDIRPEALAELSLRAKRARLKNISIASRLDGTFPGVLVDAPCSGSGTWRRAPHLKWTTTDAQIAAMAARQKELLQKFSAHVAPGGRLVYATCSLSRRENEDVIEHFLAARPDFEPAPFARTFGFSLRGPGFTILPATHDTDGFFVASLRRK
jgi:16S rRNA (cytosine967-C5)-methyltransferase